MTGYSLHLGLNAVDPASYQGWNGQLMGCENDARAMLNIAQSRNMRSVILLTPEATSSTFVRLVTELAWRAVPGDLVFISYSGHGSQIEDINGDEIDGMDETWCLYDRMVIDREIYLLLSRFARGVRIFFSSDSCHSGTVLRDMRRSGLDRASPLLSNYYNADTIVGKAAPMEISDAVYNANKSFYNSIQLTAGLQEMRPIDAGAILISGCQDNQTSADGARYGLFTEKFLQVWANGQFSGSYQEMHRRIAWLMPPTQTPNLYTVGTLPSGFDLEPVLSTGEMVGRTAVGAAATQRVALGDQAQDDRASRAQELEKFRDELTLHLRLDPARAEYSLGSKLENLLRASADRLAELSVWIRANRENNRGTRPSSFGSHDDSEVESARSRLSRGIEEGSADKEDKVEKSDNGSRKEGKRENH